MSVCSYFNLLAFCDGWNKFEKKKKINQEYDYLFEHMIESRKNVALALREEKKNTE